MRWQALITKNDNGYAVDFKNGDSPGICVYQEKDTATEIEDKNHIVEMFYDILEHFGEIGSKHDAKRLYIEYRAQK